jgi:hypothetical protein
MRLLFWSLVSWCFGASLSACIDPVDPRWTLDHDHVIAARATPPRIRVGEATNMDALVAHNDGPVTVEDPMTAEVVSAPPEDQLRANVPVPVEVLLTFPNIDPQRTDRAALPPFRVKKTVWLGEPSDNPAMPPVVVGDVALAPENDAAEVVVPIGEDTYLSVDVPDGIRVNWLTNVGELFQDDVKRAFVRVQPDDKLTGQLVVVIRDDDGGVAWRVLPMRAE